MWRVSTPLQLNPTSCLTRTTHYYRQFPLSLGKESPYMYTVSSLNSTCLILKLNVNIFYGLVSEPFNKVLQWFLFNFNLTKFLWFCAQVSMTPTSRAFWAHFFWYHCTQDSLHFCFYSFFKRYFCQQVTSKLIITLFKQSCTSKILACEPQTYFQSSLRSLWKITSVNPGGKTISVTWNLLFWCWPIRAKDRIKLKWLLVTSRVAVLVFWRELSNTVWNVNFTTFTRFPAD